MTDFYDYATRMQNAMRLMVKEIIGEVAKEGLSDPHHFFITFDTQHPLVQMDQTLRKQFPKDMTIVIQHEFYGLEATDGHMEITLSFSDTPQRLVIPWDAMITFVDPSVDFGVRLAPERDESEIEESPMAIVEDDDIPDEDPAGEVISLDQFRKK